MKCLEIKQLRRKDNRMAQKILYLAVLFCILATLLCPPRIASADRLQQDECINPTNPIVAENCKPGTSSWRITQLKGDIEGFASATSVSPGEQIDFYVNTSASSFDMQIYRSGYYGGAGGRLVHTADDLPGQMQPDCHFERQIGLVSCSNWKASYSLTIPQDWVSGVYLVKLVRPDTDGENYMLFVVRDELRQAEMLFQLSVTTYAAYNPYGNKSLYSSLSWDYCPTVTGAPRAVGVSYDRPYAQAPVNENSYFWTDYPMVFWLEAMGYDLSYQTNIDTHLAGLPGVSNTLLEHKAFLSVGHDEYWTQEMRSAVEAARDAGVHLGFFSSNVSYWRIRLEPDPWNRQPDRVVVTYKTTESGPADPSGQPTTTWRDPLGANDPENSLVGIQYIGDNDIHYFPLRVSAEQAQDRIYRYTGLADMPAGGYADLGKHLVGWEWDAQANNGKDPKGLTILASTPVYGGILLDAGRQYNYQSASAQVSRYTAPSGAIVFASGTNHWSWGLAIYEPNQVIQQITLNLLTDMGLVAATPVAYLVQDDQSALGHTLDAAPALTKFYDPLLGSEIEGFMKAWGVVDFDLQEPGSSFEVNQTAITSSLPQILNLSAVPGYDGATFDWETDVPADGQVWVKITPGPVDWSLPGEGIGARPIAAEVAQEELSIGHTLTVRGLQPNHLYYYQIASRSAIGEVIISDEKTFHTTANGPLVAKFKAAYRSEYRQVRCWAAANPLLAKSLFGVLAFLALLAVSFVIWFWPHRRRSRLAATNPTN